MHVVGARFATLDAANAALAEIRSEVPVERGDVAVRPLGSTQYDVPTRDLLLAGRFGSADADRVIEILRRHGGTLLSHRVEWPNPTLNARREPMGAQSARDPRGLRDSRDQRARAGEGHGRQAGHTAVPRRPGPKRARRPAMRLHVQRARDGRFSA